jgi:hypothetical protein
LHGPEGIRPPDFLPLTNGRGDEGVMKMRGCGEIKGETSWAACEKAVLVIGQTGNDHFDDLLGKTRGRGWVQHGGRRGNILQKHTQNFFPSSIPNPHGK